MAEAAAQSRSSSAAGRSRSGRVGSRVPRALAARCSTTLFHDPGTMLSASWVTLSRGLEGFLFSVAHRRRRRHRGRARPDPARGDRLDDHRPADDAVGRVGAARDHPVPRGPGNGHVRRGARRRTVDRQRHHQRHRPRAAAAAARRTRARRPRLRRVAPRRDPGRAPGGRRRPEAGLGVRVAQLDGRRAPSARWADKLGIGQLLNELRWCKPTTSACSKR